MDTVITGASRGIGRALAVALARRASTGDRIFAVARDRARLGALAAEAPICAPVVADLSTVAAARACGEDLARRLSAGAVLVHGAGIWPSRRETADGLEVAFATNCVAPLALQAPLLEACALARVMVISAGLLVKGRFDAARTPTGEDFSALRTYATTKLAGAAAMRDAARAHPDVDFVVVHPGVVRTDLGARDGLLGRVLALVKRRWEAPEVCGERLARILEAPRWERAPGEAPWLMKEVEAPWPEVVDRDAAAVRGAVARLLG